MLNDDLARRYIHPLQPLPTGLEPINRLSESVRCLLFDVYGTLLISGSGDIGISKKNTSGPMLLLEQLLADYGIASSPEALVRDLFNAISSQHETLRQAGVDVPEVEIERIWQALLQINDLERARRFALEFELITNPVYPMPHLAQLLNAARNRHIPMGIVSNAQFYTPLVLEWFVKDDLTRLGFESKLMHYSYRCGYAKPSLHMFHNAREACVKLGIRAQNILYLGNDMRNDMMPAAECGMQTALFAGDKRSLRLRSEDPRSRDVKPDMIVTDLDQLIEVL